MKKHILSILTVCLAAAMLFTGCSTSGSATAQEQTKYPTEEQTEAPTEPLDGALLAVIYYLACFIENINVIGAEGQECSLDGLQIGLSGEALDGMEDGGGIVHHAKGINDGAELLVGKACAYLIGKARPYEEHLLASPYPKPRVVNIYNRSKIHFFFFCNG